MAWPDDGQTESKHPPCRAMAATMATLIILDHRVITSDSHVATCSVILTVKKLAADRQDQFGGVAAAAGNSRKVQFAPVTAPPPPTTKDLAGYFDNLAAAATNEKAVLDQLVANNATLTTTNVKMTDAITSLQANVQMLRQEVSGFKQLLANGRGRDGG